MKLNRWLIWLVLGDMLALLVISIIGFLTHREPIDWHILTTFLPYLVAWVLTAPWLGAYRAGLTYDLRQVWRPVLAAFLAAPMAAWLRGVWLNRAILPVFVLALGLSAALGFGVWRFLWALVIYRTRKNG